MTHPSGVAESSGGAGLGPITSLVMALEQALNTGSLAWTTCTGIAYWYMVASWGGYSFVINIIPIHTLVRRAWRLQMASDHVWAVWLSHDGRCAVSLLSHHASVSWWQEMQGTLFPAQACWSAAVNCQWIRKPQRLRVLPDRDSLPGAGLHRDGAAVWAAVRRLCALHRHGDPRSRCDRTRYTEHNAMAAFIKHFQHFQDTAGQCMCAMRCPACRRHQFAWWQASSWQS